MHFSEILSLLLPESAKNLLLLILSTRCLARNAIFDNRYWHKLSQYSAGARPTYFLRSYHGKNPYVLHGRASIT